MSIRQVAGIFALSYVIVVVAIFGNAAASMSSLAALIYVAAAVIAPLVVLAGDRLARRGNGHADAASQLGLGLIAGIWLLPASSGLVAIFAVIAGIWSAARSVHHRAVALLALICGTALGLALLALSITRT